MRERELYAVVRKWTKKRLKQGYKPWELKEELSSIVNGAAFPKSRLLRPEEVMARLTSGISLRTN